MGTPVTSHSGHIEANVADSVHEVVTHLTQWGVPIRKYDPRQPRAPRGADNGGQWVPEGVRTIPLSERPSAVFARDDKGGHIAGAWNVAGGGGDFASQKAAARQEAEYLIENYDPNDARLASGYMQTGFQVKVDNGYISVEEAPWHSTKYPGYFETMDGFEQAVTEATYEGALWKVRDAWGTLSNEGLSVDLQDAVARFRKGGMTLGELHDHTGSTLRHQSELSPEGHKFLDAFVQHTYKATQAKLKSKGITKLDLFRGMKTSRPLTTGKLHLPTRPLSSFSEDENYALSFAQYTINNANMGDYGYLYHATIPAPNIFSYNDEHTLGWNYEVIVLPNTVEGVLTQEDVVAKSLGTPIRKYNPELFASEGLLIGDVAKRFNPGQPRDPAGTPTGGQWTTSRGNVWSFSEGEPKAAMAAERAQAALSAAGVPLFPAEVKVYDNAGTVALLSDLTNSNVTTAWYNPSAPGVLSLNVDKKNLADGLVHEYGHMLDYELFKGRSGFATGDPSSRAGKVAHLAATQAGPKFTAWKYKDGGYWASYQEIFARAFNQYVVTKAKGAEAAHVHYAILDNFWTGEEFAPVSDAFDALFAEQGVE